MSDDYRATPALSQSGVKDMLVSPLYFWHRNVRQDRVEGPPTPAMTLGTAIHMAILEPSKFPEKYMLYPLKEGALDTVSDMKEWLSSNGFPPPAPKLLKDGVAALCAATDPAVRIYDREVEAAKASGKELLSKDFWERVKGCYDAAFAEPAIRQLLANGEAEVRLDGKDSETGCPLKGRLDWLRGDGVIVDLKTFSRRSSKSVDQTIIDAIKFEKYPIQTWFYENLRRQQPGAPKPKNYVNIFVESEPPHEIRLRSLKQCEFGNQVNAFWSSAEIDCRRAMRMYVAYRDRFSLEPWRENQKIEPVTDEEITRF